MNISSFLGKKIEVSNKKSFSSLIIKVGILSISIAVSVLIISFFILNGFKNSIKERLFSLTSHIQISKITLNRSFEEASLPNNLDLFKKIKRIPSVKSVNKVAFKSVILKSEEEISGVVMKGVDANYDWKEFEKNIISGRRPIILDNSICMEILVSANIQKDLKLKLNDELLIYFIQNPPRARKVKIVGVYSSNVEELDQIYFLGDLKLIQKINSWDKNEFGHYEVWLRDINYLEASQKIISNTVPPEYQVLNVTEIIPQFFDWFKLLDRNIVIVISLIIIVAAFNMVSVLLIMIMERTPMIGLLKSLGAQNKLIRRIFLYNGSKIVMNGLIVGNLLGLGLSFIQYKYKIVKLDPVNYYMAHVPIEWNWEIVGLINISVFVLVMAILLLPSLIISKVSPVKALKYKD